MAPAGAWGAADVIRNSGYSFDRPTYYSDEGELVQYEHSGGSPHDVVSTQYLDGRPLFQSALISSGTTPVNGTPFLAPGTYPFICTIHAGMEAELVVRPFEPPPTEPPPNEPPVGDDPRDTTADIATIRKVRAAGPARIKRGRKATYRVKITNSGDASATGVRMRVRGRGVGSGKSVGRIPGGTTRKVRVTVKPKKSGRIEISFGVRSRNAGGKTAKLKVRVRR